MNEKIRISAIIVLTVTLLSLVATVGHVHTDTFVTVEGNIAGSAVLMSHKVDVVIEEEESKIQSFGMAPVLEEEDVYESVDEIKYVDVYNVLNVRQEPEEDANILDKIPVNTEVRVTEIYDNGFCRVGYGEVRFGFVAYKYLSDEKVEIKVVEQKKEIKPQQQTQTVQQEVQVQQPVQTQQSSYSWSGEQLTPRAGTIYGPSGKETYYNLDMSGVLRIMQDYGYYNYSVGADGVKRLDGYVMVAADLSIRPRGSLVPTSLGMGLVCDTGTFIYSDPYQLDIAVAW